MWLPLAQGPTDVAINTGISLGDWILRGGVPAVLLFFVGVLLYALKKQVEKNELLITANAALHAGMTAKVEELMGKQIVATAPNAVALEKASTQLQATQETIKDNQAMITQLRAELKAEKRDRTAGD